MPAKQIKAVLFDLGETLLNFGRVKTSRLFREGARSSYDFLKNLGQPVGNFYYYCWRNLIHLRLKRLFTGIAGRDFDALELLKKVGTKKGANLDEDQWRQLAWLWYEPLKNICRLEPKVRETLTALKQSGLKLGLISNTFVNSCLLEKHLEQVGLLEFFPVRLYSYEFKFRKPDVRIFKIAAERIGEALENIVFVGDRIDRDIKGALEVGMAPVLKDAYTNAGRETPKGAWKINKLSELPGLIKKISDSNVNQSQNQKIPTKTNLQKA